MGIGGSGERARVRAGLLFVKNEQGRVGNGYVLHPFLLDESEKLQGNCGFAVEELLVVAKPVIVGIMILKLYNVEELNFFFLALAMMWIKLYISI